MRATARRTRRQPDDASRGSTSRVPKLTDPHASLRDHVLQGVLDGAGESDPAIRKAAADGTGVPADLQVLVDKIHQHAYKVTDDDIASVQTKYGDDQLFEIVVSAALGASRQRLVAGLTALDAA